MDHRASKARKLRKGVTLVRKAAACMMSLVLAVGLVPSAAFAVGSDDLLQGGTADQTRAVQFTQLDNAVRQGGADFALADDGEEDSDEPALDEYADDDIVRVSIELEGKGALDAGFSADGIGTDFVAKAYRSGLERHQDSEVKAIEEALDAQIDVKQNLTLAADVISAEVRYGDLDAIRDVAGVKEVYIENRYEAPVATVEDVADPNMATSSAQIGSSAAYAAGYTGAGSRIAVIDTGIDTDHQSFDADGLAYSFKQNARKANVTESSYVKSLNLLDAEEIEAVKSQLHLEADVEASQLCVNEKIAFGYNYIDEDLDITHDNDSQGEHGSHVEGIAAANTYIPDGEGGFVNALDTVGVQGVAPDAQIITMKVFGKAGGAYDSDYMVAIEDAIVLGADSINLSLGSAMAGRTKAADLYQGIFDSLAEHGSVVSISAGNSYDWSHRTKSNNGKLYAEETNFDTVGSPASYTNSMAVASATNIGRTGTKFSVAGTDVFYTETRYTNEPLAAFAGKYDFIMIPGDGTDEDFAAVASQLKGKVAFCGLGTNYFYEKAENAVKYGAVATVVYNNVDSGTYRMGLSKYTKTEPVVSISMADWKAIRDNAVATLDDEGEVMYWSGKMTIDGSTTRVDKVSDSTTMSPFSSWGLAGDLGLKPEITAPGGNIYSVNGRVEGGKAYENMSGTSMAAPQVTGMAAVLAQYIRENDLVAKTGKSERQLAQSLLMSTAEPLIDPETDGQYYPVIEQGAGLANVGNAVLATSLVTVESDATASAADGKVKVELGQDKERTGSYDFTFGITNMSDRDASYTLSGDLFTQALSTEDGVDYLETTTTPVAANLLFKVNGVEYRPESKIDCDLNADGVTDAADAQVILDYAAGLDDSIAEKADADGDGEVTTHDAHVILDNMETQLVTVAAGTTLYVNANVALTDEAKETLNADYVNGAYLEGYIFANPGTDERGALDDVTHSIPIAGFYGAWDEASMYDISSMTDRLYGDTRDTHFGTLNAGRYNGLTVNRGTGARVYNVVGNPYAVEDEYPAGKVAVNGSDSLYTYRNIVIRNAAARMAVVTNEAGKVIYAGDLQTNVYGAFYHSFFGWMFNDAAYTINATPRSFGAKEGDVLTVSMVTVPELYGLDGEITKDRLIEMVENDELGRGCYLSTTVRVDDTAPVVSFVSQDIKTGNFLVTARDNQYIAAVRVANRTGSHTYKTIVPDQQHEGDSVTVDLGDLSDINLPNYWSIVVCDYAGNETAYQLITDPSIDVSVGQLHGFAYYYNMSAAGAGTGNRIISIDPEGAWFHYASVNNNGGYELVGNVPAKMTAAEYVGGYVYMVGADNHFYVARQGDFENTLDAGPIPEGIANIRDLAYNYQDQTLYALGMSETHGVNTQYDGQSEIYKVDLQTCNLTLAYTIKAHLNAIAEEHSTDENNRNHLREMLTMTIDDQGNFYATSYGLPSHPYDNCYLYKWSLDDANEEGVIEPYPVNDTATGKLGAYSYDTYFGSLAWDHDSGTMYWANGGNSYSQCTLYVVNPETGAISKTNTGVGASYARGYASLLPGPVSGLYVVPSKAEPLNVSASEATSILLNKTELNMLTGSSTELKATIYPWCLNDMSVIWESSDDSVVNVSAGGGVYAVSGGTATITATPVANPSIQATCTINVRDVTPMNLTALATERAQTDESAGKVEWVDFSTGDLNNVVSVHDSDHDYIGASEGLTTDGPRIIARSQEADEDGNVTANDMYFVDPDTFKSTLVKTAPANWTESEVAPMQIIDGAERFGFYMLPYLNGTTPRIKILNTDGSQRGDVILSSTYTVPIVAIAYAGFDESYDVRLSPTAAEKLRPTEKFYYLLADGRIVPWNYYLDQVSNRYPTGSYLVNSTGAAISVPSIVSDNLYKSDGSNNISMIWNEADQALLISFTEDGTTKFYEVDPVTGLYTFVGTLGGDVQQVTDLYQYERVTDQVVWITSKVHEVFEKEQIQLSARVLPGQYTDKVVWSSSDESIAVVDPDTGLVTGMGDGDVTMTATSVDPDENGIHAYATVDVHVTGLARVPGVTLRGQVTKTAVDEDGEAVEETTWANIDAGEVSDGLSGSTAADIALYGGGILSNGKFLGTDAAYTRTNSAPEVNLYQADPVTGTATQGGALTVDQGFQAATSVPAAIYKVQDGEGNEKEVTAFGKDFAVTRLKSAYASRALFLVDDWETGALTRIGTATNANAGFLAGTTGLQYYQTRYDDDGVPIADLLVGYYTGAPYIYSLTPHYDPETDAITYTFAQTSNGVACYVDGSNFAATDSGCGPIPFVYVKNANVEGIIFAHFADGDTTLFWIDFNQSTNPDYPKPVPGGMTGLNRPSYQAKKMGVLKGVTNLQGLYVSADTNPAAAEPAEPGFAEGIWDILGGAVNSITGSTQALSAAEIVALSDASESEAQASEPSAGSACSTVADDGVMTLTLAETDEVTNGLVKVKYDSAVFTYVSVEGSVQHAVLNDPDAGELTVAYAAANALAAGTPIAQVKFAYEGETVDSQLGITFEQRNDQAELSDQATLDVKDEASKAAEEQSAEDAAKAKAVEDAIAALPEAGKAKVADADSVKDVQSQFESLTKAQQALVSDKAKQKLSAVAAAVDAAIDAEKKAAEEAQAKADAIDAVRSAIDAIGMVTDTKECESDIDAAQSALDELLQKYPDAVVPNAKTLENAKAQLSKLKADAEKAAAEKAAAVKVGAIQTVGGMSYQVSANGAVTLIKGKNAKKVTIPATVKLSDGKAYRVIKIAFKAFNNAKKLKTVVIGKNVKKIAKSAFYKTPKLTKVKVKSTLLGKKASVKAAFKGSKAKNIKVVAPKAKKAAYKKSFSKSNLKAPEKVTVK